jgi:hypothetical protein
MTLLLRHFLPDSDANGSTGKVVYDDSLFHIVDEER